MGATHACISEIFLSVCCLTPKLISDGKMCVNTLFGSGSMLSKIYRVADISIEDVHMPIDMLVLPIPDFDVVLGMNWLNEYRVTVDYPSMELSFDVSGRRLKYTLIN